MIEAGLGVDVGGTKTLVGVVTADGAIVEERTRLRPHGSDDVLDAIDFACAHADGLSDARIVGAGAGFPEYVDAHGSLTSREVLTWWQQPAPILRARLRVPVRVESDVRLGAVGEATWGAGRGLSSFLYVSLGTGLSSTLVIHGEPWKGARGEAIALGERACPSPDDLDRTLEQTVSGAGLAAVYLAQTGAAPQADLSTLAAAGDAVAMRLLVHAGDELGRALADAAMLLDPESVILGGGFGSAPSPLRDRARLRFLERTRRRPAPPALRVAALGARSGMLGAAAVALRAAAIA